MMGTYQTAAKALSEFLCIYDQFCKMYYNFKTGAWQKTLDIACLATNHEDLSSKWHGYAPDHDIVCKKVSSMALAA